VLPAPVHCLSVGFVALGLVCFAIVAVDVSRHRLSVGAGLQAAAKADTISITAWQVGSFGFWFMMQIAMLCRFVTSYPANWWLLKTGIKEKR
jgi:quinol-cytochrome oxidoreductase complex cytochrome b subunit